MFTDYKNDQICDLKGFGFPVGYLGDDLELDTIEQQKHGNTKIISVPRYFLIVCYLIWMKKTGSNKSIIDLSKLIHTAQALKRFF